MNQRPGRLLPERGLAHRFVTDGGFFHNRAAAYYTTGAMSLPSSGSAPPPTSPTSGTPTTTPTVPTVPPGTYATSATAAPASVARGSSMTVTAAVTSGSATTILVDVEINGPGGGQVHQQFFDNQAFTAGQQKTFPVTWNVPANAATGTYTVKIGIFTPNWGTMHTWNDNAGTFTVTTASTPTPLPVTCSPRPPVQVSTTPSGGGLQVTVSATGQNNTLQSIEISQTKNALVDIGGQTGRTGTFTVNLPGTSASTSFTVRRQSNGAATVNLAVVDRCGRWTTFVGGGPNAF